MGTMELEDDKRDLDDSGCVQDEPITMKGCHARVELLDLSDDVLLYILRHCAPRDLKALGFSCSRLASLVLERSLWRNVDARSEPCGRHRLKWFLSHALHADTHQLMVTGFAKQAKGCLGKENGRSCEWKGADQEKEEDGGPSGENSGGRKRRAKCGLHQLPRYSGGLSWPDNPEDEDYEILSEDPIETSEGLCFGPRFTLNTTIMRQLWYRCTKLTVLKLEYCNFNCMTTAISQFPRSLKVLSLQGSKCYNVPMDKSFLYKIQDHLPELEDMNVSECEWLEPSSLLPLSKLKWLKRLLARSAVRLSEFVAYASLATRYGFRSLEELDLRGCPVGDSEVSALGWLPVLKILRLKASSVKEELQTHRHCTAIPTSKDVCLDYWEVQEPDFFKNRMQSEFEPMDCSVKNDSEGNTTTETTNGETPNNSEANIIDEDVTKAITNDFKDTKTTIKRKPETDDDKDSGSKKKKGSDNDKDDKDEKDDKFVSIANKEVNLIENNGEVNNEGNAHNSEDLDGKKDENDGTDNNIDDQNSVKPGDGKKSNKKSRDYLPHHCEEYIINESNELETYDIEMEGDNDCRCMENDEGNCDYDENYDGFQENMENSEENTNKDEENDNFDKCNDGVQGNMQNSEQSAKKDGSKKKEDTTQDEIPSTSGLNIKKKEPIDDNESEKVQENNEKESNIKGFVKNSMRSEDSQDEIPGTSGLNSERTDSSKNQEKSVENTKDTDKNTIKGDRWVRNVENAENEENSEVKQDDSESKKWGSDIIVTRYFGDETKEGPSKEDKNSDDSKNDENSNNDKPNDKNSNNDKEDDKNSNNDKQNDENCDNDKQNDGNSNNDKPNDENSNNDKQNGGNDKENDSDSSDDSEQRFHPDGVCISVIRKSGNLSLHVNPGDRIRVSKEGLKRIRDRERQNEQGRFRGVICFRRGNNEPEMANFPDDPQYRALYFNFGEPHQVMYGYGHPMSYVGGRFGNPSGSFPDPALLVSDTSIRRFGRADGERINYVMVGPFGPNPDQFLRPERSSLEELSLQGYRHITDRSLTHLSSAAPNLRRLDVRGSGVTEQGVERFRALRPDCEVLFGEIPDTNEEP